VVELVGAPGSGKTTLATLVRDDLVRRGVEAGTVADAARRHAEVTALGRMLAPVPSARIRRVLLWQAFYALASVEALRFARARRELTKCVLRSQRARPLPLRRKAHTLYWFFQLGGRLRFLESTARGREVLVVDDGFLHRASHLFASHVDRPRRGDVARYVELVPSAELVVHVTAPDDVCLRRVVDRGVWRHSRHLRRDDLERIIRASRRAGEWAVAAARSRGVPVVTVSNAHDGPEHALPAVRQALDALVGVAGEPARRPSDRVLP
jgi:adenylate kinase